MSEYFTEELTNQEKNFIWAVENNRGEMKNKDKFYPIIAEIHQNGCDAIREHARDMKIIGLQKLHKYATVLTIEEQEEFVKQVCYMKEFKRAYKIDEIFSDILRDREVN